jgi:hypothetical protein
MDWPRHFGKRKNPGQENLAGIGIAGEIVQRILGFISS